MNTFNTNLISRINNVYISEEKNNLICKKTQFHLILCRCLYEEGLITSFEIQKNNVKIILNSLLKRRKILKYVFSKKIKNTINKEELSKLNSFSNLLILSGVFGLKSSDYYRKKNKGGVSVYKLL